MLFGKKKKPARSEPEKPLQTAVWNRFVEQICSRELTSLSPAQRVAVLCFWYDTELGSGGYSGYLDNYSTDPEELEAALTTVGTPAIVANYRRARELAARSDWTAVEQNDLAYYQLAPGLIACLQAHVAVHAGEIFTENRRKQHETDSTVSTIGSPGGSAPLRQ